MSPNSSLTELFCPEPDKWDRDRLPPAGQCHSDTVLLTKK